MSWGCRGAGQCSATAPRGFMRPVVGHAGEMGLFSVFLELFRTCNSKKKFKSVSPKFKARFQNFRVLRSPEKSILIQKVLFLFLRTTYS